LAAFLQDFVTQRLVALPADPVAARAWLAGVVPLISVTDEVETSNEAFSKAPPPKPGSTARLVGADGEPGMQMPFYLRR